jgi:transposase
MSTSAGKEKTITVQFPVSDESILKIAKEIAVKFIEVGRITPSSFAADFRDIHQAIATTVRKSEE